MSGCMGQWGMVGTARRQAGRAASTSLAVLEHPLFAVLEWVMSQ